MGSNVNIVPVVLPLGAILSDHVRKMTVDAGSEQQTHTQECVSAAR